MGATSKHPGDIAIWIEKVIASCQTPMQEISARKLIQNFEKKLLAEKDPNFSYYSRTLRDRLDEKRYSTDGTLN